MERDPVHSTVVALQHELHDSIGVSKHIGLIGVGARHLIFEGNRGWGGVLLSQAGDVPYADGLVERGGGDQVFGGVELSAHNVVVMTGHGTDYEKPIVSSRYAEP